MQWAWMSIYTWVKNQFDQIDITSQFGLITRLDIYLDLNWHLSDNLISETGTTSQFDFLTVWKGKFNF